MDQSKVNESIWIKSDEKERKVYASVLEKRVACPVCYKSKHERFFAAQGQGLQQHFRTMHRELFTEKMVAEAHQLTLLLHGNETKKFLQCFSSYRLNTVSRVCIFLQQFRLVVL